MAGDAHPKVSEAFRTINIFASLLGMMLCFITVHSLLDLARILFWGGSFRGTTLALNGIWGIAAIAFLLRLRSKVSKLETDWRSANAGQV